MPPTTLDDLARNVLASFRLSVASDDVTLRFLRDVCKSQTDQPDAGGLARSAMSAINLSSIAPELTLRLSNKWTAIVSDLLLCSRREPVVGSTIYP